MKTKNKYIVLAKSHSDENPDETFVICEPVASIRRAVDIAAGLTFSFYDIKIAEIVGEFNSPDECKKALFS